jgi:hypothetical protein
MILWLDMTELNVSVTGSDNIVNIGGAGTVRILKPVMVTWNPQPDITSYELAQLLPLFLQNRALMPYDIPSDLSLRRHLTVRDPNIED